MSPEAESRLARRTLKRCGLDSDYKAWVDVFAEPLLDALDVALKDLEEARSKPKPDVKQPAPVKPGLSKKERKAITKQCAELYAMY